MYIYKLQNFLNRDILFSEKGRDIVYFEFLAKHDIQMNPFTAIILYKDANKKVTLTKFIKKIKIIDFNKLPNSIKGLFLIHKKANIFDMSQVKREMNTYQWIKFLSYSEKGE